MARWRAGRLARHEGTAGEHAFPYEPVDPRPVLTGLGSIVDLSGEGLWRTWTDHIEVEDTTEALRRDWRAVGSCLYGAMHELGHERGPADPQDRNQGSTSAGLSELGSRIAAGMAPGMKIYVVEDTEQAKQLSFFGEDATEGSDDQTRPTAPEAAKVYVMNAAPGATASWLRHFKDFLSADEGHLATAEGVNLTVFVIGGDRGSARKTFIVLNEDAGMTDGLEDHGRRAQQR